MDYKNRALQSMKNTTHIPEEFGTKHKGTYACCFLSVYIHEIWMKIGKTATPEQLEKFAEFEQAYIDIINDLSHVYRLEVTVDEYQYRLEKLFRENFELKKENKKLLESINF